MVTKEINRTPIEEIDPEKGNGHLELDKLLFAPNCPKNLRTFAKATLEPGAMVGYHEHFGESESYYILSGVGEYSGDGVIYKVEPGDVTFTPNGHGHSIKNIGDTPLVFIALIILD